MSVVMVSSVEVMTDACRANPFDELAYKALADALVESGKSEQRAKRIVREFRKTAQAAGLMQKAADMLTGDGAKAVRCRSTVRRRVFAGNHVPIAVDDSAAAPILSGEPGQHFFKDGGPCKYPGAARRKGYRTVYQPSTERIVVGYRWVLENCK